jgi:hypothetical protein
VSAAVCRGLSYVPLHYFVFSRWRFSAMFI